MAERLGDPGTNEAVRNELPALHPPQEGHERQVDGDHEQGQLQLYQSITPTVPRMIAESVIQLMSPHWVKRVSVSMSLVTRATSTPRRLSVWSARLESVDVAEHADAQVHEHGLGHVDEPDQRHPGGPGDDADDDERAERNGPQESGPVAVITEQTLVEHELHEDRDDQATGRSGERHEDGDEEAVAELWGDGEPSLEDGEAADLGGLVVDQGRRVVECLELGELLGHQASPCSYAVTSAR